MRYLWKSLLCIITAILFINNTNDLKAQELLDTIEFELTNNRILLKNITLNEHKDLVFVFDVGSGSCGLLPAEIERFNLKEDPDKKVTAIGAGGEMEIPVYAGNTISFGKTSMRDLDLGYLPIPPMKTKSGKESSGIIGIDLLKAYIVNINFEKNVIELYKKENYEYTGNGKKVKLDFFEQIPLLTGSITTSEGELLKGKLVFDTGNPFSMLVQSAFVHKHNMLKDKDKMEKSSIGGFGASTVDIYKTVLPSIKIGDVEIKDIPAALLTKAFLEDGTLAHLGMDILKKFNCTFDYNNALVYMEKNRNFDILVKKRVRKTKSDISIHTAAKDGNLEFIKAEYSKNPESINSLDKYGSTPLHRAVFSNRNEVVKFLVDKKANLNIQESQYRASPLHWAVYKANKEIVELLLKNGADISLIDKMNMTPLTLAQNTGKKDIVDLINKYKK